METKKNGDNELAKAIKEIIFDKHRELKQLQSEINHLKLKVIYLENQSANAKKSIFYFQRLEKQYCKQRMERIENGN